MSNTGKLQGKVALITGASSGIGEATALALAAEGAQVVTVARRQEQLDDLAKRIKVQGRQAFPIVADVADEAQVRNMVQIEKPTDVLVKITSTNICGSDLHMYEGRTSVECGNVLGHENLGEQLLDVIADDVIEQARLVGVYER